jgi:hypothetical protein
MIALTKAAEDKAALAPSQGTVWSGDRVQLKFFVHPVGARDESSGVSKRLFWLSAKICIQ